MRSHKKINYRYLIVLFCILLVIIYATLSFYKFREDLNVTLYNKTKDDLVQSTKKSIVMLQKEIQDCFAQLEMITVFCETDGREENTDIIDRLRFENKTKPYIKYSLAGIDGTEYSGNGRRNNIKEEPYFKKAAKGENVISEVLQKNNHTYIVLAAPIYKDNKVAGIAKAEYNIQYFTSLMADFQFSNIGTILIMQKNGRLITPLKNMEKYNSFYDILARLKVEHNEIERLQNKVQKKETGLLSYHQEGHTYILTFAPVGIEDWYMLDLVLEEPVTEQFRHISMEVFCLMGKILFVVAGLCFGILTLYRLTLRTVEERAEQERFRLVAEQAGSIIYEYNIEKDVLFCSSNFREMFGFYPSDLKRFQSLIHKQEMTEFNHMAEELRINGEFKRKEVRIRRYDGVYFWCFITGKVIYNKWKRPISVIGKIENIENEKEEIQKLTTLSQLDELTGIYNKSTIRKRIEDFISGLGNSGTYAFGILDLDNFKIVNDTLGHNIGDAVLIETAENLKKVFEDYENKVVFGRFGGDEFIFFIEKEISVDELKKKLDKICHLYERNQQFPVSASIGVAFYSKDGTNYEELFEHADEALYLGKKLGKNQYCIYEKKE